MNKENKAVVQAYLRDVKKELTSSSSIKASLTKTLKQQIQALQEAGEALTREKLEAQIGTPQEIARGFENRDDIEQLKKKARRYVIVRWACVVCALLTAFAIGLTIAIVLSNDTYHVVVSDATETSRTYEETPGQP